MNAALVKVCGQLGLSPTADDLATRAVAEPVIEIARMGVRSPDELCARVLAAFGIDDE